MGMRGSISRNDQADRAPIAGTRRAGWHLRSPSYDVFFALALWNERHPILERTYFRFDRKRRQSGEDVKDTILPRLTPTHSYMKSISTKYPQAGISLQPAAGRKSTSQQSEPEYELLDTGVFYENRYFERIRGIREG